MPLWIHGSLFVISELHLLILSPFYRVLMGRLFQFQKCIKFFSVCQSWLIPCFGQACYIFRQGNFLCQQTCTAEYYTCIQTSFCDVNTNNTSSDLRVMLYLQIWYQIMVRKIGANMLAREGRHPREDHTYPKRSNYMPPWGEGSPKGLRRGVSRGGHCKQGAAMSCNTPCHICGIWDSLPN